MRNSVRSEYVVTFSRNIPPCADNYDVQIAGAFDREHYAYVLLGVLSMRDVVRSINVWQVDNTGKRRLATTWCRSSMSNWWIGREGDYEAVMAHEPMLELRKRGIRECCGEGVFPWAETILALSWEQYDALGLQLRTRVSGAGSAGDGPSSEGPDVLIV